MRISLFTILILLCLGTANTFAERHENDTNNTLYISNIHFDSPSQATLTVSMKNNVDIGGFQFDLLLPEGFSVNHSIDDFGDTEIAASLAGNRTNNTRHTFAVEPLDESFSQVRVLCYSGTSKNFINNDGPVAQITIDIASTVAGCLHTAKLKDVVVSNANDTYEMVEIPFSVPALSEGNVMTFGADVSAVDLSIVTGLPEGTTVQTANPNALIFTSEQKLSNTSNVVVGSSCSNLVLTDGYSFNCPTPFTANSATYTRTMANKWGTIVLPCDVESTSDVTYYLPEKIEDNTLVLTRQDKLTANTPAIVAKLNDSGITCCNTNVTVQTAYNDITSSTVTMHGSYAMNTIITNPDAFYIKENQFWRCNENFHADAFRAYFTASGVPVAAKSLAIFCTDETNGIAETTDATKAEITVSYDVTGKRRSALHNGINIVKLSNGETKKIILK